MPTIATLYCRQIQVTSLGKLIQDIFWHPGFTHPKRKRPIYLGKYRLGMQVFICGYVLIFATLVSVLSGYRAQLTGYYGYDPVRVSQLQPVSQLTQPRMVIFNGSRVGLSDLPIYVREKIPVTPLDERGTFYSISEFIVDSRDFEEPYGVLVDYYYTCLGVITAAAAPWLKEGDAKTDYTLECARHKCSCSARDVPAFPSYETGSGYEAFVAARRLNISATVTSVISINGTLWELPAPPLMVGIVGSSRSRSSSWIDSTTSSMRYWGRQGQFPDIVQPTFLFSDSSEAPNDVYWNNGTTFDGNTIKRTRRCISEDAYSCGFSSLLLLTFCCFTIAFAVALILLQTDVYWNSRSDRLHQSHSLYTDVLYLAEELKASFGGEAKSPKTFSKQVERQKHAHALRLETDGLPLSRWHEWRLARAAKAATRKGRAPPKYTDSLAHKLRRLRPRKGDQLAAPTMEYEALTSTVRSAPQLEAAGSLGGSCTVGERDL